MYSNTSAQYWQQRKKPSDGKKKVLFFCGVLGLAFIGCTFLSSARRARAQKDEIERSRRRQLEITEGHQQHCEEHVKFMNNECTSLCNGERKSIPRPTMYQSCLHGCLGAYHDAAVIGCRQGSEEDAFDEVNLNSAEHCSDYKNTLPRPEVLSTCRKYYREGTKIGRRSGLRYLHHLFDADGTSLEKT